MALTFLLAALTFATTAVDVPYAACAHLSRPGEFETRGQELDLMRKAGLGWVRTDFDWKVVEPQEGVWTFDHLDALLADAEKSGIQVLPILDYEVAFAPRPWEETSLPLWRRYVRTVVSRYRTRCPVWEIWNEQNATQGGTHPLPAPSEYVRLLRAAYEEIKGVDPKLRVAIGGFAGVPFAYIEDVYKAGGKDIFDIMNVHPYQHTAAAEGAMEKQYGKLRALMARYGDEKKPVWATEIGLETNVTRLMAKGFLVAALKTVDSRRKWRLLQIVNRVRPKQNVRAHDALPGILAKELAGTGYSFDVCSFDELHARLSSERYDAILMPLNEEYPKEALDDLVEFVAAGGTIVESGGMAFFHPMVRGSDGGWRRVERSDEPFRRFRFRNAFGHSNKTLPTRAKSQATEVFDFKGVLPQGGRAGGWGEVRFFFPEGLKEGDSFTPLMVAPTKDGKTAATAAWIRYGSDMKGNLILSGYFERGVEPFDAEEQAIGCARQLNLAFALGYEKVFWYELLRCSDFGIVERKSFSPRPAYKAFQTFVSARPAGSVQLAEKWKTDDGDVYCPQWRLPDGSVGGALWSVSGRGTLPSDLKLGKITKVMDYLGNELKRLPKVLGDTPVYFRFVSAFSAKGRVLEPKVENVKDGVFHSARRIPGVETAGNAVVLEGDRLYYGGSSTLYVYDVVNPLQPRLLGCVGGIGSIRQIAVWKGMVYIASRETGMWIVDARLPATPKLISRFDTVELATGISVVGNLVMLGQRQNGVEFIDVTDPFKPAHIRIEKTNESQSTLYRDGICFSGDWGAGEVTLIDAHDMRTVKTLRTIPLRGNGDGLDLQGNLLYASTGHHYHDLTGKTPRARKPGESGYGEGHAIEIFDISDLSNPRCLGRCKFDTFYRIGMDMWTLRASGDYVFCADTYNGLYAVDAKDPAAMRIVGRIIVPDPEKNRIGTTPVTSVAVGNGTVYMAARDCGLVVVDCPVARARKPVYPKEPENLDYRQIYSQELRHFTTWTPRLRGQVRAVAPFGDFVYVACGQAGLSILKEKDGVYSEVAAFDLPFCGDVKIRDGKLYSAEALQGLAVYDLAEPLSPKLLERVTDFGETICCPLWIWTPTTTRYVIVSNRQSGYAILDPEAGWKRLLRSPGCPGWDRYFSNELLGGRYFAQSLANIGFAWIDMACTPPKIIRSAVNTSGLNGGCTAWKGDRLLLSSKGELLYLQPGQPENPDGSHWRGVPIRSDAGGGPVRDGQPVWDGGRLLSMTARISKQVWKLDMTDENEPKVIWSEKLVGHPDLSAFHKGRILVPCGYQGLLIEKRQ